LLPHDSSRRGPSREVDSAWVVPNHLKRLVVCKQVLMLLLLLMIEYSIVLIVVSLFTHNASHTPCLAKSPSQIMGLKISFFSGIRESILVRSCVSPDTISLLFTAIAGIRFLVFRTHRNVFLLSMHIVCLPPQSYLPGFKLGAKKIAHSWSISALTNTS